MSSPTTVARPRSHMGDGNLYGEPPWWWRLERHKGEPPMDKSKNPDPYDDFDSVMSACGQLAAVSDPDASEAWTVFRQSIVQQLIDHGYGAERAEQVIEDLVQYHRA
jgi:hypothetical protein